ncbi:MAG: Lrp/AsnC ligand binding domain-containing protein [Nitrososphaerota archaeon]|jgi:DNA-binding Lrp family transcriptional regulator|nr:Lrp/AsnC ligand binding domain-containing protein [Nitrososphaerota archaeon]MCH8995840.1 Lrp/AsnC ligand binding domain-containing protein [Nitrososphaerota archaeon]MDG7054022.1 Lrp/AsnC ligand binding domain-containing protein [Nitrososphaerota archaeon]
MEKAYIFLSCEIGKELEIASQLRTINEIKNVMITYGEYDIVVEAETKNSDKMDNLLTSKIRKLEKIRSTITLRVTI